MEISSITALLVTALMLALFVSCIAVEIAVPKGRKALRLGNGIAAGISFLAGLFLMAGTLSLLSGFVCGAVTWFFATWYGGFISKSIERQLHMAPDVVKFALANFNRLNPDSNGELTREGLNRLLDSGSLSAHDHRMVMHMNSKLDDIGHVTGETFVSTGTGFGSVVSQVAASQEDLKTYEQRIRSQHANWR